MSREMKFRAWNEDQNRYIDINGLSIEFGGMINQGGVYGVTEQGFLREFPISEIILEQFTGLKDNNDKGIYEGDICEIRYNNNTENVVGLVKWFDNHTHFSIEANVGGLYSISFGGSVVEGVYVIGDVHQDPGLLK